MSWMTPFFINSGRDPSRSQEAVYEALSTFSPKVRYINGLWNNELEKRIAGYAACVNRYIFRVDADEILFFDNHQLECFFNSEFSVAEMEMPIYVAPGWITMHRGNKKIARQAFLFDSKKITAQSHLDYLWLILPKQEEERRSGPDTTQIFPDPVAFNAHLTHWRPPETAVSRARFYLLNYIRGHGSIPWLPGYKYTDRDGFSGFFDLIAADTLTDILSGSQIVAQPPDLNDLDLKVTPLSSEQESRFIWLYDQFLDGLKQLNLRYSQRWSAIVRGLAHSIDITRKNAKTCLTDDGILNLIFSEPIAEAKVEVLNFTETSPYINTISVPFSIDYNMLRCNVSVLPTALRQTVLISVWNESMKPVFSFKIFRNA